MFWIKNSINYVVIIFFLLLIWSFAQTPMVLEKTPMSIVVGTLIATIGGTMITIFPSYLIMGMMIGIIKISTNYLNLLKHVIYILSSIPSIIIGVIGFTVFSNWLGFGWSLLSATLTLMLLLFPIMTISLFQVVNPFVSKYFDLAKSLHVSKNEFLFVIIPTMKKFELMEVMSLSWARALGDTAAVMLTCGTLLEMPNSPFDSIRLLNYHIYLLAMEEPGGMPEAKTLSFIVLITIFIIMLVPRLFIIKRAYE